MPSPYSFKPMDGADSREISGWRYEPPYDFYDATADPADLAELLDPRRREDAYFSVLDDGELVGFFQFEGEDGTVDVGLGLRPDLTGEGLGRGFVLSGLEFAEERFAPVRRFTLSVATFNERAVKVYERAGFRRGRVYLHETNGGEHEFLSMEREA